VSSGVTELADSVLVISRILRNQKIVLFKIASVSFNHQLHWGVDMLHQFVRYTDISPEAHQ
jgi:hypothetical protein